MAELVRAGPTPEFGTICPQFCTKLASINAPDIHEWPDDGCPLLQKGWGYAILMPVHIIIRGLHISGRSTVIIKR